jgi:adenylate cyclase
MGLQSLIEETTSTLVKTAWSIRDGQVVPSTDTVALKDEAVRLRATYVYADMANSTDLAQSVNSEVVAKVIRTYLNAATRCMKHYGGEVRSFDGDRVMAIFVGTSKNTSALKAAFALEWAVTQVIRGKLDSQYPRSLAAWTMEQGIGIATGEALIVRGGVRGDNDLVSIGDAPNIAAKLSEIRNGFPLHVTDAVHDNAHESVKQSLDGTSFWVPGTDPVIGGHEIGTWMASYWRKP